MSEQAAQELARGSAALSRVVELEARSRRLEADKVKAEDALRKEKHGMWSESCPPNSLCAV